MAGFRVLCDKYVTALSSNVGTVGEVAALLEHTTGSDQEKKTCLDVAFRKALLNKVVATDQVVRGYIELSFESAQAGYCSTSTPYYVLADVFDCLTLDRCQEIFSYVEEKSVLFASEAPANRNVVLRLCNDLIRRCSKSINTLFCGRIQIMLAKIFPISERSGLNLQSQFNLENMTEYNTSSENSETPMDTDSKEVTFLFYQTLWSIQDYFRNPNQISNDAHWKKMEDTVNEICRIFENYKHEGSCPVSNEEAYFAKFLTSERLLTLQISDSNFRRHILVQILTLFQYLTGDVKFKPNKLVLSEPRKLWIRDTTNKIYSVLSDTPPEGDKFVQHIKSILKYEEKWSKWKNEGCPALSKLPDKTLQAKQKNLKRSVKAMDLSSDKFDLCNQTLTDLWNICPDNTAACQDSNRKFTPETFKFFEDSIEQLEPDSGVEKEYYLTNETAFVWRSLRLLARQSVPYFQHIQNTKNLTLTDNLQNIIMLIGKEYKKENGME
ncbi:THO complex subunit 1-like [Bolinopsis microptera]|uniref:THO complex subunit 1-like n=1 Tax=Bolinopsis microptera TaxID=2820187 RepID=UPI003078F595